MAKNYRFSINENTLEAWFEEFITAKAAEGRSSGTLRAYQYHFLGIRRFLNVRMDLDDVTEQTIRRAVGQMARTDLSRNSIRSYTATLSSFFSWLRSQGVTNVKIGLFQGEDTVPTTYSVSELERLLKRPKRGSSFIEFRTWVIINLLVNNGIRAASVRAIEVQDVSLDDSVIYLRHTKNRRNQAIPLSPELSKILEEYIRIRKGEPDDPLFPDANGCTMSANCLRNAIRRYNLGRGIQKTGIHAFRHTFARLYLVECGGNALKLQRLLGHQTLDMTKKYVQIFDRDLIDDFRKKSPLEVLQKKTSIRRTPG